MKTFVLLLSITVFAYCSTAQEQAVPLKERIAGADFIFEGKVLSSESLWNEEHNNIYTLHRIEVYKIFKGGPRSEKVIVVTPGGVVGDKAMIADHSLKLQANKIGLFFMKKAVGKFSVTETCYDPFAGQQSLIEYDLVDKKAADSFKVYKNINKNLYKVIRKKTKQPYIEVKHFDINSKNS